MSAQVAYLGTSIADWVGELSSSDPLQRRLGAYALGSVGIHREFITAAARWIMEAKL